MDGCGCFLKASPLYSVLETIHSKRASQAIFATRDLASFVSRQGNLGLRQLAIFWKELMDLTGVEQALSSTYHPQTDG